MQTRWLLDRHFGSPTLLLSGDVELNPGWQGLSTEGEDYLLNFASEINRDSNNFNVARLEK